MPDVVSDIAIPPAINEDLIAAVCMLKSNSGSSFIARHSIGLQKICRHCCPTNQHSTDKPPGRFAFSGREPLQQRRNLHGTNTSKVRNRWQPVNRMPRLQLGKRRESDVCRYQQRSKHSCRGTMRSRSTNNQSQPEQRRGNPACLIRNMLRIILVIIRHPRFIGAARDAFGGLSHVKVSHFSPNHCVGWPQNDDCDDRGSNNVP